MTTPAANEPKRKPGRPRSQAVEEAVLQTTVDLLIEVGLKNMSMDAIAARAGVSKATLYKWWPSKLHLGLDALLSRGKVQAVVPDTGSAVEDFVLNAQGISRFYTDPKIGPCIMQLWGECLNSPDLLALYRERFLSRRRAGLHVIHERGVARGDIDGRYGVELALDIIYGPLIMRLLTGHGLVNDHEVEQLVRASFAGLIPR
ncbi:TetR/AcrR family transcriptional regulator [Asticcacaulis sp.]|uniref:TetR/AcrR family transcriptional regulator n=1 Tax=Asticcacaulis sp. TaxID=1872648 RepID=UPI003F7B946B